jgi:hypothetical protein
LLALCLSSLFVYLVHPLPVLAVYLLGKLIVFLDFIFAGGPSCMSAYYLSVLSTYDYSIVHMYSTCLLGLTLTFYLAELSASYLSLLCTCSMALQYMFLAVRMAVILSLVAFYLLLSQAFYLHQAWLSAKYLSMMSTCSIALSTYFWLSFLPVVDVKFSAFYLLPGVAVCKVHCLAVYL